MNHSLNVGLSWNGCSCLPALVPLAHQTGFHAIPALQTVASVTTVFTSYFTHRPAAWRGFCSGQHSQLCDTCGGDGDGPRVGSHPIAAFQCSISAKERSSVLATSTNRVRRTLNITRGVLISPDATNSLRSSWPIGDLEHSAIWSSYLIRTSKRPDPFDFFSRAGTRSLITRSV